MGLGYFCCIKKRIDEVKGELDTALKAAKSKDGSMEESRVKAYEDLRKWLDENTLQGILKWLDCIDKTTFQTAGGSGSSVISNITKRDILFLSMLGLKEFEPKPIARIVKGSN